MADLIPSIAAHALGGVVLACGIWAVGLGCLPRLQERRAPLGYAVGLLVVTAASVLVLLTPWLAIVALPLVAAPVVRLVRVRPGWLAEGARLLAWTLPSAVGLGFALAWLVHPPTAEHDSNAYGDFVYYAVKLDWARHSLVPLRDFTVEGANSNYVEGAPTFVGAALSHLPGFDPFLFGAATLPAFLVAALAIGFGLTRACRESAARVARRRVRRVPDLAHGERARRAGSSRGVRAVRAVARGRDARGLDRALRGGGARLRAHQGLRRHRARRARRLRTRPPARVARSRCAAVHRPGRCSRRDRDRGLPHHVELARSPSRREVPSRGRGAGAERRADGAKHAGLDARAADRRRVTAARGARACARVDVRGRAHGGHRGNVVRRRPRLRHHDRARGAAGGALPARGARCAARAAHARARGGGRVGAVCVVPRHLRGANRGVLRRPLRPRSAGCADSSTARPCGRSGRCRRRPGADRARSGADDAVRGGLRRVATRSPDGAPRRARVHVPDRTGDHGLPGLELLPGRGPATGLPGRVVEQ